MRSRSSRSAKSIVTLPRLAPICTLTRVSRWSASSSSSSSRPGRPQPRRRRSGRRRRSARCRRRVRPVRRRSPAPERAAAADGLLDRRAPTSPRRPLARASCSWSARSGVPSSARAWPAESLPSASRCWTAGGSAEQAQRVGDRRAALADAVGDLLVGEIEVLDQLLERGRLLERGEVLAVEVLDQRLLDRRRGRRSSRTIAGIVARPARRAARHRRSPAISW